MDIRLKEMDVGGIAGLPGFVFIRLGLIGSASGNTIPNAQFHWRKNHRAYHGWSMGCSWDANGIRRFLLLVIIPAMRLPGLGDHWVWVGQRGICSAGSGRSICSAAASNDASSAGCGGCMERVFSLLWICAFASSYSNVRSVSLCDIIVFIEWVVVCCSHSMSGPWWRMPATSFHLFSYCYWFLRRQILSVYFPECHQYAQGVHPLRQHPFQRLHPCVSFVYATGSTPLGRS